MIKSFADKRTEKIYNGQKIKRLDAAIGIEGLRVPPSNKLEKKEGNLKGFYAIWVNRQWRIIFKWTGGDAHVVELVDYH